ncbi:MAG: PBP1A family penicillin-binding protein [Geobacter sp.]|nr:PBP1A family penicillin-binding protein [Geobacter sp.]
MQLYAGKQKTRRQLPRRAGTPPTLKLLKVVAAIFVLALLFTIGYSAIILLKLPKVDRLADYHPPIVTQVLGEEGSLVGEFYLERRTVVPVNKIPRKLIQAFVAAEDSNFYKHKGLDYLGILRAAFKNLISMRKKEGASTITQQVARSMLLTPEKKFSRKIKEAILATRMEKRLSKDDILYIYLNQIYLGAGSYGVQVAAESYFGKDVDQLNLAEMAMLAGLPKAPNSYSPIKHLDKAKERQNYVLTRMVEEGYITQAEADHARSTPIVIHPRKIVNGEQSAYFLENIRIQLEQKYGEDLLYKGGLRIYTTMNGEMQKAAYEAVVNGLKAVDKRQGFRGPLQYLTAETLEPFCKKIEDGIDTASLKAGATYQGVVVGMNPAKKELTVRVGERTGILKRSDMAWAGNAALVDAWGKPAEKGKAISLGSVVEVSVKTPDANKAGAVFALDQEPQVQAAIVALDPKTGGVKAMVGGYNFNKSQFNRAIQARRNAGSAFKPIIYGAALEKGMTPATIIEDSPAEYDSGKEKAWKPRNYDNIYRGPVTMREALTNSINSVSVKILDSIGVNTAIEYATRLGITSPLDPNLTLALGSSSVTPLELTSAYAVFASGGMKVTPYFVTKVEDGSGKVLEETAPPLPVPVVAPENAYIMTNLMESVVSSGTGQRARALGRPVAGKTGTTNDMKDAWFIGFTPQLLAGVWVGFDQERSLGAAGTGGQAAAPIWTEFMQKSLARLPSETFMPPENVTFASINPKTGKLARDGSEGSVMECFVSGTEPKVYDDDGGKGDAGE